MRLSEIAAALLSVVGLLSAVAGAGFFFTGNRPVGIGAGVAGLVLIGVSAVIRNTVPGAGRTVTAAPADPTSE